MRLKFPSALSLLLIISVLVAGLTWMIPSGKYDTLAYDSDASVFIQENTEGKKILSAEQSVLDSMAIKIPVEKFTNGDIYKAIGIPNTYKVVEANPQGIKELIMAPVKGIIATADIIFLVLIIGGLIGVMNRTGAFNAGISWFARVLKGREYLLIIVVTLLIAAGGTSFGMAEETMAFFPILIPVFLIAGYDAMVGLACIFLGSAVGTMCSTTNPFSSIIASDSAGINWTVGLNGRLFMLGVCLLITLIYILRYAAKVKKDPSKSIIYEEKEMIEKLFSSAAPSEKIEMTTRHKLILVVFSLAFIVTVIGVSGFGWWFVEMTSVFVVASIIIGLMAGISESDFLDSFMKGAGDLLSVAFIIGVARGISIIMEDGLISDSILYSASNAIDGMHSSIFANLMFSKKL